jgi:hypothetical protein
MKMLARRIKGSERRTTRMSWMRASRSNPSSVLLNLLARRSYRRHSRHPKLYVIRLLDYLTVGGAQSWLTLQSILRPTTPTAARTKTPKTVNFRSPLLSQRSAHDDVSAAPSQQDGEEGTISMGEVDASIPSQEKKQATFFQRSKKVSPAMYTVHHYQPIMLIESDDFPI